MQIGYIFYLSLFNWNPVGGAQLICLTYLLPRFSDVLNSNFKCDITIDCCATINGNGIEYDKLDVYGSLTRYAIQLQRAANPAVRVLLGVGRVLQSTEMSSSLSSESSREAVLASIERHVTSFGYDGIYINWQYPMVDNHGFIGNQSQDRDNLSRFLRTIKDRLGQDFIECLIAMNIPEPPSQALYDCEALKPTVDYVTLMTTKIYSLEHEQLGHLAPLFGLPRRGSDRDKSIDHVVTSWLSCFKVPSKVFVDILSASVMVQRAKGKMSATAPSSGGSYKMYSDVCPNKLEPPLYEVAWVEGWSVPVATNDTRWVSFENNKSLAAKVDYVISHQLGGMTFGEPLDDDLYNKCDQGPFPTLSVVSELLHKTTEPADTSQGVIIYMLYLDHLCTWYHGNNSLSDLHSDQAFDQQASARY
ncbi:Chitotriosidase-1 [Halotydeus destructor]|nr:Chitotriosidase-1 [Halotydeus destructor]